jgi:hypothetical protein
VWRIHNAPVDAGGDEFVGVGSFFHDLMVEVLPAGDHAQRAHGLEEQG